MSTPVELAAMRARAERAEAEVESLQRAWDYHDTDCAAVEDERKALAAKLDDVRALSDKWLRLAASAMDPDVRDWCRAAGIELGGVLDGGDA